MKIICNCLNVVLQGRDDKYGVLDNTLKNILGTHAFFKENIATVELVDLKIKLPNIVENQHCGQWLIHRCLNCGVFVFARNQDADTDTVIVNCSLTCDDAKIAKLKKSEFYSQMFGIVVDYKDACESGTAPTDEELDQKLKQWIEKQKILTEERVQAYIEQQYSELEKSKAIALRDHIAISRIVSKRKITPTNTSSTPITKNPLKEIQQSYEKGDKLTNNDRLNPNRTTFDSEGLFAFDDLNEDSSVIDRCDVGGLEDPEDNENVDVHRREEPGQFARSLPVAVPQFMQRRQHNDSSSGSPNVPTDIAASIKALAKSVHGDAVFGELPRPRFSTNL